MDRRVLLEWGCRLLGAACAAVVVIPGVRYIIDPLQRKTSEAQDFKRLTLLDDLTTNVPKHVPVMGSMQDAWTHYQDTKIGDTWIVRLSPADVPPEEAQVNAYNMICPHLGCDIQKGRGESAFICPCHNAEFNIDGGAINQNGFVNPAPRGMDVLESRLVLDEDSGQWWVEVKFENFVIGATQQIPKA